MYCTARGTEPIFCDNCKWGITFKHCELLCCTPITYMMFYINYTTIRKSI